MFVYINIEGLDKNVENESPELKAALARYLFEAVLVKSLGEESEAYYNRNIEQAIISDPEGEKLEVYMKDLMFTGIPRLELDILETMFPDEMDIDFYEPDIWPILVNNHQILVTDELVHP